MLRRSEGDLRPLPDLMGRRLDTFAVLDHLRDVLVRTRNLLRLRPPTSALCQSIRTQPFFSNSATNVESLSLTLVKPTSSLAPIAAPISARHACTTLDNTSFGGVFGMTLTMSSVFVAVRSLERCRPS